MATKYTKKHYIDIAKVINGLSFKIESITEKEKKEIAIAFSDMFLLDSSKFDYDRFIEACMQYSRRL